MQPAALRLPGRKLPVHRFGPAPAWPHLRTGAGIYSAVDTFSRSFTLFGPNFRATKDIAGQYLASVRGTFAFNLSLAVFRVFPYGSGLISHSRRASARIDASSSEHRGASSGCRPYPPLLPVSAKEYPTSIRRPNGEAAGGYRYISNLFPSTVRMS